MRRKRIVTVIIVFLIADIVVLGAWIGMGPLGFLQDIRIGAKAGNAEEFHLDNVKTLKESPLQGMRLAFLGSSVTKGSESLGISFVEYMAKRNSFDYVKEAVSGTTLVDNGKDSYIRRMRDNISKDEKFDGIIVQLSTNDATKKLPIGEISNSKDIENLNTLTIAGAIEYIIGYSRETWDCPVIFYTGTKYNSPEYEEMVNILLEIQKKWNISLINLWENEEISTVSNENYKLYMSDEIHPTQAGYLKMVTPVMESSLYDILGSK